MAYMRDEEGNRLDGFPVQRAQRDFDVIVAGATEAGVFAAVAAAREQKSVLLISDSERIGGTTGYAMTQTDLNTATPMPPGSVGGLVREFFLGIADGTTVQGFDSWHRAGGNARPSAWARAFNQFVAGLPITILHSADVTAVSKTGTRITSVTAGGKVYTARVFVDATTTGDVARLAGCTVSIGREAAALYTETGAGVLAPASMSIDPYVTPGSAGSGLLYGVSSGAAGTVGAGDGAVMTFGWRQFLTSVTADQADWPEPGNYDATKYELLCRRWAQDAAYYNSATIDSNSGVMQAFTRSFTVYPLGLTSTANAYIDLNSYQYLSSNYPNAAECLEYVTATPARRAVIRQNARDWQLGLFKFILTSSDSRIPANLKTAFSAYKPSKYELRAYGGLSPQFYVREGARIVGDFVLNLNNATVGSDYGDYVAFGNYDFDGHTVRVINVGGVAHLEGTVVRTASASELGFPIPYRVLTPKVAEVTNLLCPQNPSVSRMVFCAVRAIPVLMQLGAAAGYAAAIAASEGLNVQAIDVARIQRAQNLKRVYGASAIISADSTYQDGTRVETGAGAAFANVTTGKRFGNVGALVKSVPASTARVATYSPNIRKAGWYRIFISYPPSPTTDGAGTKRATNITVTIVHKDGTATRTINQQFPGGVGGLWEDLGAFYLERGLPNTTHTVAINAATGTDGIVVDDAVKWVLVQQPY